MVNKTAQSTCPIQPGEFWPVHSGTDVSAHREGAGQTCYPFPSRGEVTRASAEVEPSLDMLGNVQDVMPL